MSSEFTSTRPAAHFEVQFAREILIDSICFFLYIDEPLIENREDFSKVVDREETIAQTG